MRNLFFVGFVILFLFNLGCISFQNSKNNFQEQQKSLQEIFCENNSGIIKSLSFNGSKVLFCEFENNSKCELNAFFNKECSKVSPNFCISDFDCDCGVNKITKECFVGQKEFVNNSIQCPDFCSGIAANLEVKCIKNQCKLVNKFKEDKPKNEKFCKDLCGDGICQEVVCLAVGCPCAETKESCPSDCAN
jgi:hypothetical protein